MLIRRVMRFRNAYHKPRQNIFWIQLIYIYFCFCYIHFEISGDPWLSLRIAPLFALNCIFFPANEEAPLKYNKQSDFKACLICRNQSNCRKMKKQLLQLSTDQVTTGSIKYLDRLKNPMPERLNFAISKWL